MSRVLTRLFAAAATTTALLGLAVAPASAATTAVAATAAPYLAKVDGQTDGLVFQADQANPSTNYQSPSYAKPSALHPGWTANLANVRAQVLADQTNGSSDASSQTNFALYDRQQEPIVRLNGVNTGAGCLTGGPVYIGGSVNLKFFLRHNGQPQETVIEYGRTYTLDRVHPGDVYFPDQNDFRLTTVTLSKPQRFADLAAYPQFAGHTAPSRGVIGYRLTIEQRVTPDSPAKVYEFLVGVSVCSA
ncbi:hypothetical protein JOF56_011207 [Kibdelosporangium banguiense]|uniref:Tat pathway signal sequence domain protein n=1 Tax=Kibdelosporangium banguiense TaxID=1365924 RepID=A0ABS4U2D7_9PSEU|nr:hypothetical protein [Kibdelosporangium banguiense]MBP2330822.1 hypothetical protein [Kibdelosporangium banguiense]